MRSATLATGFDRSRNKTPLRKFCDVEEISRLQMFRETRIVGRNRLRLDRDVHATLFRRTVVIDLAREIAERSLMLTRNLRSRKLKLRILRRDHILLPARRGGR